MRTQKLGPEFVTGIMLFFVKAIIWPIFQWTHKNEKVHKRDKLE